MKRPLIVLSLFVAVNAAAATPEAAATAARRYRMANEQKIVDELVRFLAIPNVASDTPNIEKNAAAIAAMFAKRGIEARLLRVAGAPPLVVADLPAPGAKQTIAFYAHYDGQPVDPAQWSTPPWEPVIVPSGALQPESRIYARSAGDDKSPIVALLAALDALRSAKIRPSVNLKFVFEGEEEAGSPHLAEYLETFAGELSPDAWIICDGPVHQSRRP
ncbi:MAG TPA: M20/M25/M40 family metallo-hydrolase, partial [Thermoanaerobaculia bacterium]|nr:M20/M25/M40 family metallo-hydrolase [Thermoanaerobaculia bacterium]